MKRYILIGLLVMMILVAGCDIELGHSGEDHDHDGDGEQDHAAEDHVDEDDHSEEEDDHSDEN